MLGRVEDGSAIPDLHEFAQVHDGHPMGDVTDHRKVVRDHQQRDAEIRLKATQQLEEVESLIVV